MLIRGGYSEEESDLQFETAFNEQDVHDNIEQLRGMLSPNLGRPSPEMIKEFMEKHGGMFVEQMSLLAEAILKSYIMNEWGDDEEEEKK